MVAEDDSFSDETVLLVFAPVVDEHLLIVIDRNRDKNADEVFRFVDHIFVLQ